MENENTQDVDSELNQVPQQESNCGLSVERNPLAQPTDDNGVPDTKKRMFDTCQLRTKATFHQNAVSSEYHQTSIADESSIADEFSSPESNRAIVSNCYSEKGESRRGPEENNDVTVEGLGDLPNNTGGRDTPPANNEAYRHAPNTQKPLPIERLQEDSLIEQLGTLTPDVDNSGDFQEPGTDDCDEHDQLEAVKKEQKLDVPKKTLVHRTRQFILGKNNKSPTKSVQGISRKRQVAAHDGINNTKNLDDQNVGTECDPVKVRQYHSHTVIKISSKKELDSLNPELGDLILVKRYGGAYSHYMIYVGDGHVVHLTGGVRDSMHGTIAIVKIQKLTDVVTPRSHLLIVKRGTWKGRSPFPAQKVVERAFSHVGKIVSFSPIHKNCEHFARWCKYGQACSPQAEIYQQFLQWFTCGIFKPLRDQTSHLKHSSQVQKKHRLSWSYENYAYEEI